MMFGLAGKNRKRRGTTRDWWGYWIHDGASEFRFQLAGPLESGDVAELDQCWETASSTVAGKAVIVDLTRLTAIDDSGRALLAKLRQAGAEFVGGPDGVGHDSVRVSPDSNARQGLGILVSAGLVALFTLLFPVTLRAADSATPAAAISATPAPAPDSALARYFDGLDNSQPWGQESVDIEAALPKLKEHGRLRAIRRLLPHGKPQYQVFEQDGSRTVRQQVIARYLSAEVEAAGMTPSAVSVTPANYRFRYEGAVASDTGLEYVYQITPRQKRTGLIQGMLWIDARTGAAVRLSGYLVKKPSIFIKRVDVTREATLRDGVVESRVTHLALDTRLVGRAELVIHEHPCGDCGDVGAVGSNDEN